MKINSKFQDYYDSALGSFIESDVVFNRNPGITILPVSNKKYATLGEDFNSVLHAAQGYLRDHTKLIEDSKVSAKLIWAANLYVIWLGFCGKYYPMVTPSGTVGEIVWNQYDRTPDPLNWLSFFFNPKARLTVDHTDFKTVKRYSNIFADMEMKMGFKFSNPKQEEYKYPGLADFWKDEAFERFGPIFLMIYPVYGKYTKGSPNIFIIRNPSLKTLSFQKVMDPFITLYTLNEWLDTHARPDEAVVPVGDDKTRLISHGFDPKTSFRKSKEKK